MASLARPSSTAGHCLHISRGSSGVHSSGFHCPCQEPEPQEKTALPPLRTHLLCCCSAGTREPTPAVGAVSPPPGPHVGLSFTREAKRAGDGGLSWARGPPSQLRPPRPLLLPGRRPSSQETAEAEVLGTLSQHPLHSGPLPPRPGPCL
uniref:Uncharacterized protein n=1 Tax=Rangifer tarandus platyrhynchus TaxID=3082113 RepID=A0ACB0DPS6_RANTA|nr:unnamed protein product [Rangifer tarandus platyrhynchus]